MATLCPHCGRDVESARTNGSAVQANGTSAESTRPYPNAAPKADAIKQLYSMIMSGKATEIKDFARGIKISNKLLGEPNEQ